MEEILLPGTVVTFKPTTQATRNDVVYTGVINKVHLPGRHYVIYVTDPRLPNPVKFVSFDAVKIRGNAQRRQRPSSGQRPGGKRTRAYESEEEDADDELAAVFDLLAMENNPRKRPSDVQGSPSKRLSYRPEAQKRQSGEMDRPSKRFEPRVNNTRLREEDDEGQRERKRMVMDALERVEREYLRRWDTPEKIERLLHDFFELDGDGELLELMLATTASDEQYDFLVEDDTVDPNRFIHQFIALYTDDVNNDTLHVMNMVNFMAMWVER
jgi:hypothetical protein